MEGKPCQGDADCGVATHTCVEGACHDPFAYCRPNVVIVFSDGEETEHVHTDDFFHPRVQAKRLHFGLGCASDDECLDTATCSGGVCTPPASEIDGAALVCETGGLPCTSSAECPDPCVGGCQTECLPASVDLVEGAGADVLTDYAGVPISLTVHVVDASGGVIRRPVRIAEESRKTGSPISCLPGFLSGPAVAAPSDLVARFLRARPAYGSYPASGVPGANELIARYGGGLHFSVDLSDPGELVATVDSIIGNAKDGVTCE